jgi:hypothetical protein
MRRFIAALQLPLSEMIVKPRENLKCAAPLFVTDFNVVSGRWVDVRQAEQFKTYHTVATTPLLAICASRVSSVALVRRASAAIIRSCISVTALHASKSSV